MENSYLDILNQNKQIANIKECNLVTQKYGLVLSDNQIMNLLEKRKEALKNTGIFYEYKNETIDLLADEELIKFMKKSFDGICHGSTKHLAETIMDKMKNDLLQGKSLQQIEEGEEFE